MVLHLDLSMASFEEQLMQSLTSLMKIVALKLVSGLLQNILISLQKLQA